MLMLCGMPAVVDNLSRSKSYSERMFATQELGNLRPPEDRAAFVDPAVRQGRRYADEVGDGVMEDSGGYPFFIQVYSDALWDRSASGNIFQSEPRLPATPVF